MGDTEDVNRNKGINNVAQAILSVLPRVFGTFTLAAAATTTVPQTATQSTSYITLTPLNAAAATLMGGAKSLYVSARVQGASFTVATANAAAAAGTEQFSYTITNPV